MVLVMTVMFNYPDCSVAKGISAQCWTILRRWVKKMVEEVDDSEQTVEEDMKKQNVEIILNLVEHLIGILPDMTRLQTELL